MSDEREESIAGVGYINDEHKHALISIFNPALLNPRRDYLQFAITIETAIQLRAALNAFLNQHGIRPN